MRNDKEKGIKDLHIFGESNLVIRWLERNIINRSLALDNLINSTIDL
jgi:hypothetical protein